MSVLIEILKFTIVESIPYIMRWLKSNDNNKKHYKEKEQDEWKQDFKIKK